VPSSFSPSDVTSWNTTSSKLNIGRESIRIKEKKESKYYFGLISMLYRDIKIPKTLM